MTPNHTKEDFIFTGSDYFNLKDKESELDYLRHNAEQRPIITRFNLGFGIFGIPEQCKDGKYTTVEEFNKYVSYLISSENIRDLEDQIEFLQYKKALSEYISRQNWHIIGLSLINLIVTALWYFK